MTKTLYNLKQMEQLNKVLDFLKTLPTWSRIIALVAMAALAFALTSCTHRVYRMKLEADHIEATYQDSLIQKNLNF